MSQQEQQNNMAASPTDGVAEKITKKVRYALGSKSACAAVLGIDHFDNFSENPVVVTRSSNDDDNDRVLCHQSTEPAAAISSMIDAQGDGYSAYIQAEAWKGLAEVVVRYKGARVGTLAARHDPHAPLLNYNQVFVRDFIPTALAFLLRDPPDKAIVKNFLLTTLELQDRVKEVDNFTLASGVMPASFFVKHKKEQDPPETEDKLEANYGGTAIGRVAPIDSGFWWIILLKFYVTSTKDYTLLKQSKVQKGIEKILTLCLSDGFDTFPTLLCADGCCMIDRRLGMYGCPIEIQALFFYALRCAKLLLIPKNDHKGLLDKIEKRIEALSHHIGTYFWLDHTQLNKIYCYKTEEYSQTAVNKFNVMPESIPGWVFDFMPMRGGYFIGNVSPSRMDFRWFLVGNCIAILSDLATNEQAEAIMDLVDECWNELIGEMPAKICYPALDGHDWEAITGFDRKNTRWSYHNAGSWPVLLWLLTSACIKTGRTELAHRAILLAEERLGKDEWPEYYDGKAGRYIGKQARKHQTWSMAGYLVAKKMVQNPDNLSVITINEDNPSTCV